MTRDELRKEILDVLTIISGSDCSNLPGALRPITDLGLKSEHGVDFAGEVETRLKIKIDVKINPFVDDDKQCARSLEEITNLVEKIVSAKNKEVGIHA